MIAQLVVFGVRSDGEIEVTDRIMRGDRESFSYSDIEWCKVAVKESKFEAAFAVSLDEEGPVLLYGRRPE